MVQREKLIPRHPSGVALALGADFPGDFTCPNLGTSPAGAPSMPDAMPSKAARGVVRRLGRGSCPLREHEHFAVIDLIFRKDIRTGFRIYLNFRIGKACLDRSDGLYFVGNGDKE